MEGYTFKRNNPDMDIFASLPNEVEGYYYYPWELILTLKSSLYFDCKMATKPFKYIHTP